MSIKREEPLFSMADQIFNRETTRALASNIAAVHPSFKADQFQRKASRRFPDLTLKDRIFCLVDLLEEQLPDNFAEAVDVLNQALPEPLDPTLVDDDFGQFIWSVPGEYVARHGCTEERVNRSLAFLQQSTMRFSAESAIRPFLKQFPQETMRFVHACAEHDNYHVRRLASEGIRPYLPWAERVILPPVDVVDVLTKLHGDRTRYVTRSVANTLNDISRDHPELIIDTLKQWHQSNTQEERELQWLTRHALRTLIKAGHDQTLEFLGYPSKPAFRLTGVSVPDVVRVGENLQWKGVITSQADQNLRISLNVYFRKADGSLSPKVFALKDLSMKKGEQLLLEKSVGFKPISTRTLYPGMQAVELMVNGVARAKTSFELREK